jgi:hypothetical protein
MKWKVVGACGEHELQKQLDELQGRFARRDELGDFHLVGSISDVVPLGCTPDGTIYVAVNVNVARDPPAACDG